MSITRLAVALSLVATHAFAEVVTDGTLGPRVHLSGDFEIGPELGRRAGRNLFQSFEKFTLATGERATFSGPGEIRNIISRVTGGARSEIDGTIRSTIAGADFYFINPAGVLFGPNASLDLLGSFHVSTADELRFAGGAIFSAADPRASSFNVAAPEAFGFLDSGAGAIRIVGSTLELLVGRTISLVGGDVTVERGGIRAEAKTLRVASLGGAGAFRLVDAEVDGDQLGDVTLRDHGFLDTGGAGGGVIQIRAGNFVADRHSFVGSDNLGGIESGAVDVMADEVHVLAGSRLTADGFFSGGAGGVTVRADEIELGDGGFVQSSTSGVGNAGTVMVEADQITIDGAGAESPTGIFSRAESGSTGAAGSIVVRAGTLGISDEGRISSSTLGENHAGRTQVTADHLLIDGQGRSAGIFSDAQESTGNAGVVEIDASGGEIRLVDGGVISSGTYADGDAGSVTVEAERLRIDGSGAAGATGITARAEQGSTGVGGSARVDVGTLTILKGGQISSSTLATGRAGEVLVRADRLQVDGGGDFAGIFADAVASTGGAGVVNVEARELELMSGGLISSGTSGAGEAGSVTVRADRFLIDGAGAAGLTGIASRAERESAGVGGSAQVNAGTLTIVHGGQISSSTFTDERAGDVIVTADRLRISEAGGIAGISSDARGASGNAGVVAVRAGVIELATGGIISSSTSAAGAAGTVQVDVGRLLIDGSGVSGLTGIASQAEQDATGRAGSVMVVAGDIDLVNGGRILSSNHGAAVAGDVMVRAEHRLSLEGGAISTESASAGGGEIQLRVGDVIVLGGRSAVTTSVAAGDESTAGSITIDPKVLVIDGGEIHADAGTGSGGEVTIVADNILVPGGDFEALLERGDISATGGDPTRNGTIVVSAPEVDLSGGLVVLEGAIVDTAPLRARCGARRDIGASSFTGIGRAGLPPSPDGPLSSGHPAVVARFEPAGAAAPIAGPAGLAPPCMPLN